MCGTAIGDERDGGVAIVDGEDVSLEETLCSFLLQQDSLLTEKTIEDCQVENLLF